MDVREKSSNGKRLIDADKLLEIYKKWIPQLLSKEDEGDRRGVETCITVLGDMQTVDAVPVVRCRECKHCDPENHHCDHHMGTAAPLRRKPDDFCSYGERKEGADKG